MKTKFRVVALLLLLFGPTSMTVAQTPAIAQNYWSSGEPMPVPLDGTAVAALKSQIYVVGGDNLTDPVADTQVYDPAANAWSPGVPLPIATEGGCAGVVKNVLYFIGGNTGGQGYTDAVWAYSLKAKTWTQKAPMPIARSSMVCVVEKGVIYVMGGYNGSFLATVESYDPATDTWTELQPMLSAESDAGAGRIGTTIIVTNGSDNQADGHNQGYDVSTGTWRWLTSDSTTRQGTCIGAIGPRLYSAGGWIGDENGLTLTESFTLSKDAWKTLAPMPQGTGGLGRSLAYKGKLYCFGGEDSSGNLVGNVEIYQP